MKGISQYSSAGLRMPSPNAYVQMLYEDYADWAYCEQKAPLFKGHWRKKAFLAPETLPLDLEIGTGNGIHFAYRAQQAPERLLLGLELKYKPLIQTIRRAVRQGSENTRMARYNAHSIGELFTPEEIDNVFIHFPDPWPKKSRQKNRLLQERFWKLLYSLQKPGAFVDVKMDRRDYFDFAFSEVTKTAYKAIRYHEDLHNSPWAGENFMTQFETLFAKQGQPIYYFRVEKMKSGSTTTGPTV